MKARFHLLAILMVASRFLPTDCFAIDFLAEPSIGFGTLAFGEQTNKYSAGVEQGPMANVRAGIQMGSFFLTPSASMGHLYIKTFGSSEKLKYRYRSLGMDLGYRASESSKIWIGFYPLTLGAGTATETDFKQTGTALRIGYGYEFGKSLFGFTAGVNLEYYGFHPTESEDSLNGMVISFKPDLIMSIDVVLVSLSIPFMF